MIDCKMTFQRNELVFLRRFCCTYFSDGRHALDPSPGGGGAEAAGDSQRSGYQRHFCSFKSFFDSDYHSIEKETVCSSASDGGFLLETFDDVIKYNTGKSLLCFLKIGGNHEVQLLQLL